LKFGEPSDYLGYTAMSDYFPRYTMKPNPQCDNRHCVEAQEVYQKWLEENKESEVERKEEEKKVVHEDNEWGICVVEGSEEDNIETNEAAPEGAVYAFEKPSSNKIADEDTVKVDDDEDSITCAQLPEVTIHATHHVCDSLAHCDQHSEKFLCAGEQRTVLF